MGIHAQRGVSCADCHMPYDEEGGIKYSDHHIQNPLAVVERTCQTCHRDNKETLRHNVYERQQKADELRNLLEKELTTAHIEAKFAWDKGATENEIARHNGDGISGFLLMALLSMLHKRPCGS